MTDKELELIFRIANQSSEVEARRALFDAGYSAATGDINENGINLIDLGIVTEEQLSELSAGPAQRFIRRIN